MRVGPDFNSLCKRLKQFLGLPLLVLSHFGSLWRIEGVRVLRNLHRMMRLDFHGYIASKEPGNSSKRACERRILTNVAKEGSVCVPGRDAIHNRFHQLVGALLIECAKQSTVQKRDDPKLWSSDLQVA